MRRPSRTPASPVTQAHQGNEELYEAYLWLAEHLGLDSTPPPGAVKKGPQK